MTVLELRYRWLLRAYPAGHRDLYEEEMIGVLMADAEPGRRFPAPADVLDLLRAGLTARLGRSWPTSRRTTWGDAAAVTGLLVALVMAGVAAGRLVGGLRLRLIYDDPMRAYGVDGLLLLDPAARTLVWVAVAAAGLAGLRRTAAGLAAAALLVEAATVFWWWDMAPWQSLRLAWAPTVALLTLAALVAATRARPVRVVVGPRGTRWIAAALAVALTSLVLIDSGAVRVTIPLPADVFPFWIPMGLVGAAVWGAGQAIRLRVAALTVAVLAVPFVFLYSWDLLRLSLAVDITPGIVTTQLAVLIVTPIVTFAAGLVALGAGERFAVRRRGQVKAHE